MLPRSLRDAISAAPEATRDQETARKRCRCGGSYTAQLIKPDKAPVVAAGQQGSASAELMSGLSSDI